MVKFIHVWRVKGMVYIYAPAFKVVQCLPLNSFSCLEIFSLDFAVEIEGM